jgi:Neocarzinostatin family
MVGIRSVRVAVVALVMATGIAAGGTVGIVSASAKTKPVLVIKPSVSLKNGETVKITGSGFKPGDTVFLVECQRTAKGQSGCNTPTTSLPPSATISSKGTFAAIKFKVTTGKVGPGSCGTKKSNLAKCELSAGNISGGDTASAPITFKAP